MRRIITVICVIAGVNSASVQSRRRQSTINHDDEAVILENDGIIGEGDRPGPSVLGSMDNIFKAVKDFDQYRCLERMLCEYMQEEGDVASALLSQPFASGAALTGADPNRFQRPQEFSRPPHHHRPPPQQQGSILSDLASVFLGKRRKKRQTNVQGNIIRLFQATGMDSSNMFPYVRAALIGHATRGSVGNTRRGSSCSSLYRDCPSNSNDIVNYFNNHNGGVFNSVQPSVNQEVAPILSAIVSDVVGDTGSTQSPIVETADAIITSAVIQGATNYFGGEGSSSSSSAGSGGITGLLENGLNGLLGGGGGGGGSGSDSATAGITDAFNQFTSLFSGRKK